MLSEVAMAFMLRVVLTVIVFAALTGCNSVSDPAQGDYAETVRTTITGRVVDEEGKSVQGAVVSGHGTSTTTNGNGVFVLQNVTVPSTRAVITVRKSGYFTGARAAYPSAGKVTTMLLTLQEAKQIRSINASSGGLVTLGAASIDLPANGYIDAQGNSYSGTVSVAARYLDPQSANFYDSFSGDMAALRADGSSTELVSYGVLRVLLTGSQGQPLNLAKGAVATLTYPAAGASMSEIPLWHFDEKQGIWVEEGKATLSGGQYVGTVTHFTDWNLDVPRARRAFIEGRVTCGENIPLAGIVVDVGQVFVVTDQDGMYRRRVPADFAFDVQVPASRNEGISSTPVTVGPIAENQTFRKNIVVSPCPTLLEAQIVDCNDAPIGGFVQVVTPTGVKVASSTTGKIRVTVPAGVALTLEGYSTNGRTITSTAVSPITGGTLYNAGNLKACGGIGTAFTEFKLPLGSWAQNIALNSDGSRVALFTGWQEVFVFDASTGTQLWRTDRQWTQERFSSIRFVAADSRIAVSTGAKTTFYNAGTGEVVSTISAPGRHHATSDGSTVYVTERDRMDEYDVASGTLRRTIPLNQFDGKIAGFMGMQGNTLAVFETFNPVTLYTIDITTGGTVRSFTWRPDTLADPRYYPRAKMLSQSGKIVAIQGLVSISYLTTWLVDMTTGAEISRTTGDTVMAFSANDAQYVTWSHNKGVPAALIDLRSQRLLRPLPVGTARSYPEAFSFSGDGSKLAAIIDEDLQGVSPYDASSAIRIYHIK